MSDPKEIWRNCSSCRLPIGFKAPHFRCSISTCNKKRMFLAFCTLPCWEAHREEANHRDGWATRAVSPTREEWQALVGDDRERQHEKQKRLAATEPKVLAAKMEAQAGIRKGPREMLIVASRFKAYVEAKAHMQVAEGVFPILSDHVRELVNRAAVLSTSDGRKTLLDRDITPLIRPRRSEVIHREPTDAKLPEEVLLIVSKTKDYVKLAHALSTSDGVFVPLSDHLRRIAVESIRSAARDTRKTVLVRDMQVAVDAHFAS